MRAEQRRNRNKHISLDFQRQSIMDIKKNVEQIKAQNAIRKKQLEQLFLSKSNVQEVTRDMHFSFKGSTYNFDDPEKVSMSMAREKDRSRIKTEEDSFQFRGLHRLQKTQVFEYAPRFSKEANTRESETQTYSNDRPQRSDSIDEIKHSMQNRLNKMTVYGGKGRHDKIYDKYIGIFEAHYEVLNKVMSCLKKKMKILQQSLQEYMESVRETMFIDDFVSEYEPRHQKTLKLAKLLEMISIIYVILEMSKGTLLENYNNLVNMVGHSASNHIFIAKLFIMSQKSQDLTSSRFQEIITRFQETAYYEQLNSEYDIILRMQHNNSIILKIQTILGKFNIKFETRIKQFMKKYQRDEYSSEMTFNFLFEYLAYYLHAFQLNGITPFLDVAPEPYLPTSFQKRHLIIIEPINVLVWISNNKYFVRPYVHELIDFLAEEAEVVLWTHKMPGEIEGLLEMLDKRKKIVHRLYKYHCTNREGKAVKDIDRLGRAINSVMIIDGDHEAFGKHPDLGLEMFWMGSRRDKKLIGLIDILTEMFSKRMDCRSFMRYAQMRLAEIQTSRPRRFRHVPLRPTIKQIMKI